MPDTETQVSDIEFTFAAVVSCLFILISTVLVFSYRRHNIEVADQSLYLLMADDPRASIRSASGFHVLLAPLFGLVSKSVIGFRLLRAVIDIGVDVLLGVSFLRYLRHSARGSMFETKAAGVAVVSSITLAGFAVWIYAINGFGYDQLGGVIFALLLSVVFWIIADDGSARSDAMLAFLVGALLPLALIVRWTAAVAVGALLIWVLVDHCGKERTRAMLGAMVGGAIAASAIVHFTLIDVSVLANGIISGTSDVSRDSHSIDGLLVRYVGFGAIGLLGGIGVLLALTLTSVALKVRENFAGVFALVLVASGLVVMGAQSLLSMSDSYQANTLGTWLAVVCMALILGRVTRNWQNKENQPVTQGLSLPVLLTAAPMLLAVGTFLPLFLTALPLATLWIAALWLLVPEALTSRVRFASAFVGIVLLSAMPWLVWQSLDSPDRLEDVEDRVAIDRGRFEGLLVDETTQQMMHDLEDLRLELDPNPTVLSFWSRPGVPFALEGTALGFPWYSAKDAPNAAAQTISGACLEDGDSPTGDVVFVTEEVDPVEFGPVREALRDCGIDFPIGFDLRGTTIAPGGHELFIYVREDGDT